MEAHCLQQTGRWKISGKDSSIITIASCGSNDEEYSDIHAASINALIE